MSKLESKPVGLQIEHYYWNPFSLTIYHLDSNGNVFNLAGKTITAGVKTTRTATTFAVSFSVTVNTTLGTAVITKASADLLSSLTADTTYYWDYKIDGETILTNEFKLVTKGGNKSNTMNVTFKSNPSITLSIKVNQLGLSAGRSGTLAQLATTTGTYAGEPFLITDSGSEGIKFWHPGLEEWI